MKKLISVLFIVIISCTVFYGCTMASLPTGEKIGTSISPDKEYTINTYLCNGGATTDYSIRCEVVDKNNQARNIYWQYHQNKVKIKWKDNTTVVISGKSTHGESYEDVELDVTKDSFDYRNN